MTQSALQSITKSYHSQIKQYDQATQATLTHAHNQAIAQIQPHLDHLYREIEQAGDTLTLSFLYQGQRMRLLKQTIAHYIDQFSTFAHQMSIQAQQQGVALGTHSGQAQVKEVADGHLISTPFPQYLDAVYEHQDTTRSHLFSGYGAEAAKDVAHMLIAGVSLKQPVKELASGVLGKLKKSLHRAIVTVGETFIGAYRDVVSLFYRANSDVTQQWQWTAEAGACPICVDLDGTLYDIDEDFNAPHPNCRCEAVPVPISETEGETIE